MTHPKLTSGESFFAVELPAPSEEQVRAYQKLTRNGELTWAEAIAQLPPEEAAALIRPVELPVPEAADQSKVVDVEPSEVPQPVADAVAVPRRFLGRTYMVSRATTNAGFPRIDGDLFIAPIIEVTRVIDDSTSRWDVILWSRNIQTEPKARAAATPIVDDASPATMSAVAATAEEPGAGAESENLFRPLGKFFYRTLLFRRAPRGQRPGTTIEGGGTALHYFEFARVFHVHLPPSRGVLAWRLIIGRSTFLLT